MEEEALQKSVSTITVEGGTGALNLLFGFWNTLFSGAGRKQSLHKKPAE